MPTIVTGKATTVSDGLPTTVTELHMIILAAEAGALIQMKVRTRISNERLSLVLTMKPGRKRRRSISPFDRDRDRYDPRPRYNDDYGLKLFNFIYLSGDLPLLRFRYSLTRLRILFAST